MRRAMGALMAGEVNGDLSDTDFEIPGEVRRCIAGNGFCP
jgi:hypothetical protein